MDADAAVMVRNDEHLSARLLGGLLVIPVLEGAADVSRPDVEDFDGGPTSRKVGVALFGNRCIL